MAMISKRQSRNIGDGGISIRAKFIAAMFQDAGAVS
jgi:hypothetical protein